MSKSYTKDEAISLKKSGFKSMNSMLESFIAKPLPTNPTDTDYIKKAALISKWLQQYANYISFEEKFDPRKSISYKRGDVIFANFGFNIGAELGGEHYAVILDKENHRNSSTVTVIPLSSFKPGKSIHPNDLHLGNELYEKLQLKLKTIIPKLKEESTNHLLMLGLIKEKLTSVETSEKNSTELNALIKELENKVTNLEQEIKKAEKVKAELLSLKHGSIAKIQQITTISKMRIYNPKNASDPLYGIKFSESTMDKINDKLKEFFVF